MTSTGVQNKVQNMIFSSYFTLSDTSHFLPLTQSGLVTEKTDHFFVWCHDFQSRKRASRYKATQLKQKTWSFQNSFFDS